MGGRMEVTFLLLFSTFRQFIIWELISLHPAHYLHPQAKEISMKNINPLSTKYEAALIKIVFWFPANCGLFLLLLLRQNVEVGPTVWEGMWWSRPWLGAWDAYRKWSRIGKPAIEKGAHLYEWPSSRQSQSNVRCKVLTVDLWPAMCMRRVLEGGWLGVEKLCTGWGSSKSRIPWRSVICRLTWS